MNFDELAAIRRAATRENDGFSWVLSDPIVFNDCNSGDGGRLSGASKVLVEEPDDAAIIRREGRPDGCIREVIDGLCRISRDHNVDWEVWHDENPGLVGFIRGGTCDSGLMARVDVFVDVARMIAAELDNEGGHR